MSKTITTPEAPDWDAQKYDFWYDTHSFVYLSELAAVKALLPHSKDAVEIGVGTGRFSSRLGIPLGVEPSPNMAEIAKSRGIRIVFGEAEELPFADSSFDLVLFVTSLCFVKNVDRALNESYRILRLDGSIVIGFLDFGAPLGQRLRQQKTNTGFPNRTHFLSSGDIKKAVTKLGFTDLRFAQVLFKPYDRIKEVEPVRMGYGQGLFVVLKAKKK
jgi:SAM-dependent methyltransferase